MKICCMLSIVQTAPDFIGATVSFSLLRLPHTGAHWNGYSFSAEALKGELCNLLSFYASAERRVLRKVVILQYEHS